MKKQCQGRAEGTEDGGKGSLVQHQPASFVVPLGARYCITQVCWKSISLLDQFDTSVDGIGLFEDCHRSGSIALPSQISCHAFRGRA